MSCKSNRERNIGSASGLPKGRLASEDWVRTIWPTVVLCTTGPTLYQALGSIQGREHLLAPWGLLWLFALPGFFTWLIRQCRMPVGDNFICLVLLTTLYVFLQVGCPWRLPIRANYECTQEEFHRVACPQRMAVQTNAAGEYAAPHLWPFGNTLFLTTAIARGGFPHDCVGHIGWPPEGARLVAYVVILGPCLLVEGFLLALMQLVPLALALNLFLLWTGRDQLLRETLNVWPRQ